MFNAVSPGAQRAPFSISIGSGLGGFANFIWRPVMTEDQQASLDLLLLEQRVTTEAPSLAVAYILAICLGIVSAHRFYLRRPGSALLQILLLPLGVGVLWWIVDLFLIPGMVRDEREKIRQREMLNFLGGRSLRAQAVAPRPPSVDASLVSQLLVERGLA